MHEKIVYSHPTGNLFLLPAKCFVAYGSPPIVPDLQDKGMKDFSLSNTHCANFRKYFEMPGILRI